MAGDGKRYRRRRKGIRLRLFSSARCGSSAGHPTLVPHSYACVCSPNMATTRAKAPERMTIPALMAGAWRVTHANRPPEESLLRPATTANPTKTNVIARPALKPRTRNRPIPAWLTERASSITVTDAGQGIIPPAAPKAMIWPSVGRSPRRA